MKNSELKKNFKDAYEQYLAFNDDSKLRELYHELEKEKDGNKTELE